jgi:hypothetical protein
MPHTHGKQQRAGAGQSGRQEHPGRTATRRALRQRGLTRAIEPRQRGRIERLRGFVEQDARLIGPRRKSIRIHA